MKDTEQALTFLTLHLLCTAHGYCEWSIPRGKHNHIWLRHPLRSGTMICHQAELSHNCQYFLLVIEKAICVNFLYFIITMYHGGKTLLECLLSEFFSPRCAKGYYYLESKLATLEFPVLSLVKSLASHWNPLGLQDENAYRIFTNELKFIDSTFIIAAKS